MPRRRARVYLRCPDSATETADDDDQTPTSATSPKSTGVVEEESGSSGSVADSTGAPVPGDGLLDVLFVVDNSSAMADEQLELARAAVAWIGRVQQDADLCGERSCDDRVEEDRSAAAPGRRERWRC
jgi:hypothetical protein